MNILIVGANGFLGRNLTVKCLELGWNVDCVYHKRKDHLLPTCRSYSIEEILEIKRTYDIVFLLSACIPYRTQDCSATQLKKSNIELPIKISNKFRRSLLVFSSSVAVYGTHRSTITESSSFNNPSMYGLTKIASETISSLHPRFRIIRFSSIYGQGMNQSTFLPSIIQEAKRYNRITIFGSGTRLQDYIHVDDAVRYLLAAVKIPLSGIYLGVNGRSYSNIQVAEFVKELFPSCTMRFIGEDKSPSFRYNNKNSLKLLKIKPIINIKEALKDLI